MSLGFPFGVLPYHTHLSSIFSTINCRKWCLNGLCHRGLEMKWGFVPGLVVMAFPMGLWCSWIVDCQFVVGDFDFYRRRIGSVLLRYSSHCCQSLSTLLMGGPDVRGCLRGWGLLESGCSHLRIL